MSHSSSEEWERRKWYLIRSLFDEVPLLSPIPETQELTPSPTEEDNANTYSQLPDLIVEKEPNKHDEPEEFYKALERKVLKLYKKLFGHIEKSPKLESDNYFQILSLEASTETAKFEEITDESETSRSDNETTSSNDRFPNQDHKTIVAYTDITSDKTSTENSKQSSEERSNEIHQKRTLAKTDNYPEEDNTLSSSKNELITNHAQVHHIGGEELKNSTSSADVNRMSYSELQNTKYDENSEYIKSKNSNISDNQETGKSCSVDEDNSTPEEPEVMRRRKSIDNSMDSLNTLNVGKYFSADFTIDKTLEITSMRTMEEAKESSPELSIILGTSTISKIVKNAYARNQKNQERKRRLSLGMLSQRNMTSPKKRRFENLETQTSFSSSGDESYWQVIQNDLFDGKPCMFRLCSCNNHICL